MSYSIDTTASVTSTIPWYRTTTFPDIWTTTTHAQKCPNCGYCHCCGKSDIPGRLTPEAEPEEE